MTWLVGLVDPYRNDAGGHKIQSHGKGVEPVRLSIWHDFLAADLPSMGLAVAIIGEGDLCTECQNTISPAMVRPARERVSMTLDAMCHS